MADGTSPDLPFGAELRDLADAMTTAFGQEPVAARGALVAAAGPAVAERAIGVVATFQMMNRLLDGVGAPVNPSLHGLARTLGFEPADLPR
ncbi:MAG: hypothetical protein AAF547_01525 [Actinomycetota bacterium]